MADEPAPAPEPTPTAPPDPEAADKERAELLYAQLKAEAGDGISRDYLLARIPVNLQRHLMEKVDADFPVAEPNPDAPKAAHPGANAVGQYAAMAAAAKAAEGAKADVESKFGPPVSGEQTKGGTSPAQTPAPEPTPTP